MSTEIEPDYFRMAEQDLYKGFPKHRYITGFLLGGVVVSVLLSVISLSVVLTHYKVEIHINSNEVFTSQGSRAEAQVGNGNAKQIGVQRRTTPGENCTNPQANQLATQYIIRVRVGHIQDAQTDHPIVARLIGEYGVCGKLQLETPIDNFQLGAVDEFLVTCSEAIGELKHIEMTNTGTDGLYIETVTVENLASLRMYDMPCECWIDDEAGGGVLSRNLTVERHCTKVEL